MFSADILVKELYPSASPDARWQWVSANFDGQVVRRYVSTARMLGVPDTVSSPFFYYIQAIGDSFFVHPHYTCIRSRLEEMVKSPDPTTAPFNLHAH